MNELMIFNNPEFGEIRTVEIEGEAWFVGRDVASALGYSKPQDAVQRHVDEDDSVFHGVIDGMGRNQQTKLINEVGLYALIIMSELPSAKKFRRWITKEVIPSIVKTGSYQLPALSNTELIAKIAQSNVELERRVIAIEEKEAAREEKLDNALQILSTQSGETWRGKMERQVNALSGGKFNPGIRGKMYTDLEAATGADLNSRLKRLRKRLRKNKGITHREAEAINLLEIISRDKKLVPVFESILRQYQARYCMEGQITILDA